MPAESPGSVYPTRSGYGIRWYERNQRKFQSGFRRKTEARQWFDEHVKLRLRSGAPDPSITFDAFCALYLVRHGATVAQRTKETIEERLAPARAVFGSWTLRDLEAAQPPTSLTGARAFRTRRATGSPPPCGRCSALPQGGTT